jgi:hypothetical protein
MKVGITIYDKEGREAVILEARKGDSQVNIHV